MVSWKCNEHTKSTEEQPCVGDDILHVLYNMMQLIIKTGLQLTIIWIID